jgi:hypothetical protein
MPSEEVGQAILDAYDGVVPVASWGEISFFYNPGRALARGAYFCTIKDHDGKNDRASALDRPGVYRLSFGVSPDTFRAVVRSAPTPAGQGRGDRRIMAFHTARPAHAASCLRLDGLGLHPEPNHARL